jgi:glycosyltransferase involved in cell wall biosynthesis
MILALVTPFYFPSVRGNSITVQRIESGLQDQGVEVRVFSLDRQDRAAILAGLRRLRPDLVHGFHATATGPLAAEAAEALGVPVVITLTGTDVNLDLFDPARRPSLLGALGAARVIVAFHATIADRIRHEVPAVAGKLRVIGQAVLCDGSRYDLRAAADLHPGDVVFFQPAGIRRVKNIPAAIPPLTQLHERHPSLRYVLAGPVIEPEEASRVTAMLTRCPWAAYLGALDHDQICASLSAVEVVINSSLSEGGMSNAILEAMSKGVPVLASDIDGNRSIIVDGEDGFLFGSEADFVEKGDRLIRDPGVRSLLGRRAQRKIAAQFRLEGEIGKYLALYRSLLEEARS